MTAVPPPGKRARWRRRKLAMLMKKQNDICAICFCTMLPPYEKNHLFPPTDFTATLDHIIPIAKGGKDANNLRATHYWCNCARNADDVARPEVVEWMRGKIQKLIDAGDKRYVIMPLP